MYSDNDWSPIGFVAGRVGVDSSTLRRWVKEGRLQSRTMRRSEGGRPTMHLRVIDVRKDPQK